MQAKMLYYFLVLFLVTNGLGLLFANAFLPPEVSAEISQSVNFVNGNKNDAINAIALLAYILVATGVLLLVIRFLKGRVGILMRVVEAIAVFFITLSLLEILLAPWLDANSNWNILLLVVPIIIIVLRSQFSENIWLRNMVTILLASYVGALLGIGLGILPILVFIILLSAYDYIAVFKTKHMVTLANAVTKKNLAFTYAIPTPEHQFELGTGDLVIPLAFAASVMQQYSLKFIFPFYLLPAAAILLMSLVGLLLTLEYSSRNVGKALPALPLQTVLMVIVFLATQFLVPA